MTRELEPHALLFAYPDANLATGIFVPRPSMRLLTMFQRPAAEKWQRFTVTAGTAASGADVDVVLQSSTDRSAWTTRATIALDASAAAEVGGPDVANAFSGWIWNPATEYLRVNCTTMSAGTAPIDVWASFEWK